MNQKNEMTSGIGIKRDFRTACLQAIFAIWRESFKQQLFHREQLRLRRREQFVCMHHRLDAPHCNIVWERDGAHCQRSRYFSSRPAMPKMSSTTTRIRKISANISAALKVL